MDINTQVYAKLVTMGQHAKKADSALEKAREAVDGAYTIGVEAANMAGSWEAFEPVINLLTANIQKNVDNLAVKFGAEKRDKASKDGKRYKVPKSVSTVRGQIKAAFESGVSFVDPEGATRSYGSIRDEIRAVKDAKKLQTEAEKVASLTGVDKARHDCLAELSRIGTAVAALDLNGAMALAKALANICKAPKATGKRNKPEAGQELAAAA